MTLLQGERTASVTVAFNPDIARLEIQLRTLLPQVDALIVVDNGCRPPLADRFVDAELANAVQWLVLDENRGIAGGLNAGIAMAGTQAMTFVLCMDHDSVAPPGCVDALRDGLVRLENEGHRVAAVGPRISDPRATRDHPFITLRWLNHTHRYCAPGIRTIETDFLISSGCFARVASYQADQVGALDETLFIDSVDFEWCCRARAKGFSLFGVCAATLDHRLGDSRKTLLFARSMIIHSPVRLYYMTRNRIILYGRSYVPARWKCKDVFRMVTKLALTLLFVAPRATYLRVSVRGVVDAFSGKRGRV